MASRAAASTRFRSAIRKLTRDGIEALRPQQVPVKSSLPAASAAGIGGIGIGGGSGDAMMVDNNSVGDDFDGDLRWQKPAISKRVAKVLRKEAVRDGTYGSFDAETGVGWDPAWDAALSNNSNSTYNYLSQQQQGGGGGRYRIAVPKLTKRERTREQRAQRLERKMEGMDDRIEQHYVSRQESKPPDTFENRYKKLMKVNKK